jgi:hypothetical protein
MHLEDVDGDGDIDTVFQFRLNASGVRCGDVEATLTAKSTGGKSLSGTSAIRTSAADPDGIAGKDEERLGASAPGRLHNSQIQTNAGWSPSSSRTMRS